MQELIHNTFIFINKMTADEEKKLTIQYNYFDCIFGNILIASTDIGICYIAFDDDGKTALHELKTLYYPNAVFNKETTKMQQEALCVFSKNIANNPIMLHVKGTDFQLSVWEELLNIPMGKLTTYGNLANQLNNPKACRAVGSAVGANPVSFLIPCHRVVQSTGKYGQYHWGSDRKKAMIEWEKNK